MWAALPQYLDEKLSPDPLRQDRLGSDLPWGLLRPLLRRMIVYGAGLTSLIQLEHYSVVPYAGSVLLTTDAQGGLAAGSGRRAAPV